MESTAPGRIRAGAALSHIAIGTIVLVALVLAAGRSTAADITQPEQGSRTFNYDPDAQGFSVPEGVYFLYFQARGGHGGGQSRHIAAGGKSGVVTGVAPVSPGQTLEVDVARYGGAKGGDGYRHGGDHGTTWGPSEGYSGAGGGGATGVVNLSAGRATLFVAGGGGAGGGNDSDGAVGGAGGNGGLPAEQGYPGWDDDGGPNDEGLFGGCGGCRADGNGGGGKDTEWGEVHGGGGGGGGAGYAGGGGGDNGIWEFPQVQPVGGSGGGGGSSFMPSYTLKPAYSTNTLQCGADTSDPNCDGQVTFSWGYPATAVSVSSGSGQSVTVGQHFAALGALVTDEDGIPVPGAEVEFEVPASGPSGTFPGGQTKVRVTAGNNGVATAPTLTANDAAGQWTATAKIAGSAAPATFYLTNVKAKTNTEVGADPNPSWYDQPIQVSANVVSDNPDIPLTGNVQFMIDGAPVGSPVPVDGLGNAVLPPGDTPLLDPGNREIRATYVGDGAHASSTDVSTQVVEKLPVAVNVTSSKNPSEFGDPVTLTAELKGAVPFGATPTGTVTFVAPSGTIGMSPVDASGIAEVDTSSLPVGSNRITAQYQGDATHSAATGTLVQSVGDSATSSTISSSANPTVVGDRPTWTVSVLTIDGEAAAGTVDVSAAGQEICADVTLDGDGEASCQAPQALEAGEYEVTSEFTPGNPGYLASEGSMTQVVTRARAEVQLGVAPPAMTVGQSPVLTADVSYGVGNEAEPEGTVQFSLDGEAVGDPVTVAEGSASIDVCTEAPAACPLGAGTHLASARFVPSDPDQSTTGFRSVTFPVTKAPSSVTVTASADPTPAFAPVRLEAKVSGPPSLGEPRGRVQFLVDGQPWGEPVMLAEGSARSLFDSHLRPGTAEIEAVYLGSNLLEPSEDSRTITVGPPNPDHGAPRLLIRNTSAKVNRLGSLRLRATCFGEKGAKCEGTLVLRTLHAQPLPRAGRKPRKLKPYTEIGTRRITVPAQKTRDLRIDLNNTGGGFLTARKKVTSFVSLIPFPGTSQMDRHNVVLARSLAPRIRVLRRVAPLVRRGWALVRVRCVPGRGMCSGRVDLKLGSRIAGFEGVVLKSGKARTVRVGLRPWARRIVARSRAVVMTARTVSRSRVGAPTRHSRRVMVR